MPPPPQKRQQWWSLFFFIVCINTAEFWGGQQFVCTYTNRKCACKKNMSNDWYCIEILAGDLIYLASCLIILLVLDRFSGCCFFCFFFFSPRTIKDSRMEHYCQSWGYLKYHPNIYRNLDSTNELYLLISALQGANLCFLLTLLK